MVFGKFKQRLRNMKPSRVIFLGFVAVGIIGSMVGGIYYTNVEYFNRLELERKNEIEAIKLEKYNIQYTNYKSLRAFAEEYENSVVANVSTIKIFPFIERYDNTQVVEKLGKYGDNKTFADKLKLDYERSKGLVELIEKKEPVMYDYTVRDLFANYVVEITYGYNEKDMTLSQTVKVVSNEIGFAKRVTVVYNAKGEFVNYIVH